MSLTHYLFNDYAPFDRFFEDISNRAYRPSQPGDAFRPRLDIHHDEEANTVTATFDLPGLNKEDVTIDIHNNILTVSGETKVASDRDERGYTLRERRYGKFSRSISLPQGVKNEDIKANMDHGILNVTFPRTMPETAAAKIAIN